MNLSRSAIGLYMGLVLICGAVLGVVGERYYIAETAVRPSFQGGGGRGGGGKGGFNGAPPTPADRRKSYVDFMQKMLTLTPDQATKLSAIAEETSGLMDDLHRRQAPEQMEIQRSQEEKIRAILTPTQLAEYQRRIDRLNKINEERRGRKGGFDGKPDFDSSHK